MGKFFNTVISDISYALINRLKKKKNYANPLMGHEKLFIQYFRIIIKPLCLSKYMWNIMQVSEIIQQYSDVITLKILSFSSFEKRIPPSLPIFVLGTKNEYAEHHTSLDLHFNQIELFESNKTEIKVVNLHKMHYLSLVRQIE